MKRSIQYISIILLVTVSGFTACDSLLDVNPTYQYSADTFWQTEAHASAGLSGIYRVLFNYYSGTGNHFMEYDMVTSNAYAYNEVNGTDAISRGVHLSSSALITNLWEITYRGIGRANTFLDNMESVHMDEELKRRMEGEAKFLRAFYYQSLADKFGGVPLILETPNAAEHAYLPRNTKAEVVGQILQDLTEAVAVLPVSYSGADLGRATKGAALALKARVLLYNERWMEAAAAAKEVMDLNIYDLFDNYRTFYSIDNKYNSEVIFNIESRDPEQLTNFDHNIYVLNRPAPLKELVDCYLMDDGTPITESDRYDASDPYANRDPRLLMTIRCMGYHYNGAVTTAEDVPTTGFGMKKYITYTDDERISTIAANKSEFNPIVIRFAEVLLTYAEARNEAVGPDASVYQAINRIRKRPSVNMPEIPAGLSQDEMRQVIRLERRIELALEGLYYSDILRWRTAEIENNGPVHNADGVVIAVRSFNKDRDYLWPIPFNQIVLNPNLEQNPHWD